MNGVSVYYPPNPSSSLQSRPKSASILSRSSRSSNLRLEGLRFSGQKWSRAVNFRCSGSSGPGGSGSGDNDSRTVLDAFFLGKALAEALNERIESTVGEIFSTIGRLQAEQQKQVQEFQEDVLERAKRAKEKAAREAMEAQGLIPKAKTASSPDNGVPATPPVTANGPPAPPSLSNAAGDPIEVPISGESSDG